MAWFPRGFESREIELLTSIANNGPSAGKYLFLHYDSDATLPRHFTVESMSNIQTVDLTTAPAGFGSDHSDDRNLYSSPAFSQKIRRLFQSSIPCAISSMT